MKLLNTGVETTLKLKLFLLNNSQTIKRTAIGYFNANQDIWFFFYFNTVTYIFHIASKETISLPWCLTT